VESKDISIYQEPYMHFEYFIDKIEIIYTIFIALGFAKVFEEVIKTGWILVPLLIANALALVRIFFAPARNLAASAPRGGSSRPTSPKPFQYLSRLPRLSCYLLS